MIYPPDMLAIIRITVVASFVSWAGEIVAKAFLMVK